MKTLRRAVPTLAKYLAAGWLLAACSGDSPTGPGGTNDPDRPEPASLALDQTALSFEAVMGGEDPDAQSVGIRNAGGGTLNGLAVEVDYQGGPEGWLEVALDGTTAPATLSARPRVGGLEDGSHAASVVVRSPAASNGDRRIAVSLEVQPPPLPDLAVTSLEATAARIRQGQSVSYTATVVNQGEVASPAVRWGWYLRADSVPSDPSSVTTYRLDPLQPGEATELTVTYQTSTDLEPGLLFGGIQIDSEGDLDEANEENNALSRRLELLPQMAGPTLSGAATRFGRVALTWSFDWPCADPAARLCRTLEQGTYELQEASGGGNFETVFNSGQTSVSPFEHNLSRDPGSYRYRVRARGSEWTSAWSEELTVEVVGQGRPVAPGNLTATLSGTRQVYLEWQDNSDDETSFRIEASQSADFSSPATWDVPANQNVADFVDQAAPRTFYIRVFAVRDEAGAEALSDPSNVAVVTTTVDEQPTLEPPTMLQATVSGLDIRLTWQDNSTDETGFRIEYAPDANFSDVQSLDVAANSTSWEGHDDQGPQTLFIRVRALRGAEVSDPSNAVEIETTVPSNSTARFRNGGSYVIYSLVINGNEQLGPGQAIPPGAYYQVDVSPGSFSYQWADGIVNEDGVRWFLHYREGTFSTAGGEELEFVYQDFGAIELMARDRPEQEWRGYYLNPSDPDAGVVWVRIWFDQNGRYRAELRNGEIDGAILATSRGRYGITDRHPLVATVSFSLTPDPGQPLLSNGAGYLWEYHVDSLVPIFDVTVDGRAVQLTAVN